MHDWVTFLNYIPLKFHDVCGKRHTQNLAYAKSCPREKARFCEIRKILPYAKSCATPAGNWSRFPRVKPKNGHNVMAHSSYGCSKFAATFGCCDLSYSFMYISKECETNPIKSYRLRTSKGSSEYWSSCLRTFATFEGRSLLHT